MMDNFFNIQGDSNDLFKDCDIMRNHPDFCKEWMKKYPVIFLTLKDVEGYTFQDTYDMLKNTISKICAKLSDLLDSPEVKQRDKAAFFRLMDEKGSVSDVKNSLDTIMRILHTVYGKKVILLIDEYDVPLAKAQATKNKEFYRQMLDVIRGMMSVSLKTNEYLKFAVITGCMRITKESIFTGVNNFACYSVMNREFSRYFGFTENEVEDMLAAFGQSDKMDIIREWYDGYVFGNTEVFCPWDVVRYLSGVLGGEGIKPQNYWANTSANLILDDFVNHSKIDASDKFEELLNGGTIIEEISEEITYDHITESEKNLWSVLLMSGYLSKADMSEPEYGVKLRIPNAEIAVLFKDVVMERFRI